MFTFHCKHSFRAHRALSGSLALAAALGACAAHDEDLLAAESESVEVGVTQQALVEHWSPYTTDGSPAAECNGNGLMNGFGSKGQYSDDIRIGCSTSPHPNMVRGPSRWLAYFSEEEGRASCPAGWFITGVSCLGSYCDRVSLKCTQMVADVSKPVSLDTERCRMTGLYSEEQGESNDFGKGWYAMAASCSGKYCDSMSFTVCPADFW